MHTSLARFGVSRAGRYLRSLLAPESQPPSAPEAQPPALPVAPPRAKILVVDDDPVILKTLTMKLMAAGYAVVATTDAAAAIGAVRDERPDLALVDLTFPPDVANGGMVTWDGFQIMSWLQGIEESRRMRFIIISGSEPANCKQRLRASGAVAFFQKPIQHEDLLQAIDRILEQRSPANCQAT